jgi:N-acetyl-anhydromuramyl-L-alanine amidase AmpD
MTKNDVDAIVIHCSDTIEGKDFKAADIDRWHRLDNGWRCIGYHFVIDLDGTIEMGRPLNEEGAHCKAAGKSGKSYNKHSIGICYIGGKDKNGKHADTRTDAQKLAMVELVYSLMDNFPKIKEVIGHRDADKGRDCPCFDVKAEFPQVIITAEKTR